MLLQQLAFDLYERKLRGERRGAASIAARSWYVALAWGPTTDLVVGRDATLTLTLTEDETTDSVALRIPASCLELTVYVEAPGFHLKGEHTRTVPVVNCRPVADTIAIALKPLSGGRQPIHVRVYPGSRVKGVRPAEVVQTVSVAAPLALPDIRELIDLRAIPDPKPDLTLYVSLLESRDGQELVYHATCSALDCNREPLGSRPLTRADITALRQQAAEAARSASGAPSDSADALHAFGCPLFDQLAPPAHPLRNLFRDLSAKPIRADRPWTLLIVSDADALLPWELACRTGLRPGTQERVYEFLAERFALAHWVAREGLTLAVEAPLGPVELAHYGQRPEELPRWRTVLGGPGWADLGDPEGPFSLTQPGSPHHGLHVLRYAEPAGEGLIVAAEAIDPSRPDDRLGEHRLDFTLKRPVVGLGFVDDRPAVRPRGLWEGDPQIEAGWALPFLRAGVSALVGPRWPVSPRSERVFLRAFRDAAQAGSPLGVAVWRARRRVHELCGGADWLAYTYFGHPECRYYAVRPSRGFTLFEAIDHRDGLPFVAGQTYCFRASYRTQTTVWYNGRLHLAPLRLDDRPVTVTVVPLHPELPPLTRTLEVVPGGAALACQLDLAMPSEGNALPLLIRFRQGREDLDMLELCLDLVEAHE